MLQLEDDHQRRTQIEGYLDKGRGRCDLGQPEIARLMEDSLLLFHDRRYDLRAWVIMPNHVHVLIRVAEVPLPVIVGNWKKHTARVANRVLDRRGDFWAPDYWDTFMRDAEHERKTVSYIESNPAKANLVLDPRSWPWSSARCRDQYQRLTVRGRADVSPDPSPEEG